MSTIELKLDSAAINEALVSYIENNLGMKLAGKTCSCTFTAGRGANGNYATVAIINEVVSADVVSISTSDSIVEEIENAVTDKIQETLDFTGESPTDDTVVFDTEAQA